MKTLNGEPETAPLVASFLLSFFLFASYLLGLYLNSLLKESRIMKHPAEFFQRLFHSLSQARTHYSLISSAIYYRPSHDSSIQS